MYYKCIYIYMYIYIYIFTWSIYLNACVFWQILVLVPSNWILRWVILISDLLRLLQLLKVSLNWITWYEFPFRNLQSLSNSIISITSYIWKFVRSNQRLTVLEVCSYEKTVNFEAFVIPSQLDVKLHLGHSVYFHW